MLTRILAAAGIAALLGGCAGTPSLVLPPVRDASLPGAAGSAQELATAPIPTRNDRSAVRLENASARAGIPRPRPAEAPPARLVETGAAAAVAPRVEGEAPKKTTRQAGAETAATPGESLAAPDLPREDTMREGNSAVVALLDSARAAERERQYGRAAAALERALKVEPRNPWLWHRLATVRYRQGRYPEAEALSRRSMSLSPGEVKLESRNWRVIAAARHGQGDEEGAREALRRAKRAGRRKARSPQVGLAKRNPTSRAPRGPRTAGVGLRFANPTCRKSDPGRFALVVEAGRSPVQGRTGDRGVRLRAGGGARASATPRAGNPA